VNTEESLIFIKGEDKTDQIKSCRYINGKWQVVFINNKVFSYNYANLVQYSSPRTINHETHVVYYNNKPESGIAKIIDFGDFVRIIYKTGYKKVYPRRSILIEESCLNNKGSNDCFEYLKKLAEYVSIKDENDKSFLSKQYNKLAIISPRSVLATYLERKPLNKESTNKPQPIFPFGFNLSQKAATQKALAKHISVIEGPPGTGKTQTILNIIANAIINDKTVAVVSNNNSATANVLEKLQKYGVDFIAAYLGNSDNKDIFINEQKGFYPDMGKWTLQPSSYQSIKASLYVSQEKLDKMLEYKNRQALLNQELAMLTTEQKYFDKYYVETSRKSLEFRSIIKSKSDKILSLMVDYQRNIQKGKIPFIMKVYNLFIYGIFSFKFYNNSVDEIISFLQKTYYTNKTKEFKTDIAELTNILDNFNFEGAMNDYSENSMRLFKAKLAERFGSNRSRTVFSKDALWKSFDSFMNEYPVILSTTHSLQNCASDNFLFDYVIIDEASQVDVVAGALALSCAKNAVIVGDIKQLPNVVSSDIAEITNQIFKSYNLDSAYSYADNSLLSSIVSLHKDIPKTLLKEHYRCHPKIIGFCNQKFYNNELIILTKDSGQDKPLTVYKTAKGNHARGRLNQRQIDVVFEEIIPEQCIDDSAQSIGIISPYRPQANELKKAVGNRNIEADTVHKFQGRERDVIILTTVSNQITGGDFVDDPNLINVAVSRAAKKFIVVVSDGIDEKINTNIGDLVRYIQYNNFEVVESKIYSVFDLLYSSYSEKLLGAMKNSKNVSEYQSENLMNAVIENVLAYPAFQNLDRILHQPLKMLIRDPIKLTELEIKYSMNILTHTDFVIFNKLDKKPILVVEVDGYAYHANNPKQLMRDKMKDGILEKYGIPVMRIKTNDSGEANKLRIKLAEILGLG